MKKRENPSFLFIRSRVSPNSSMVEHAAVNRGVTGSSPVWGVKAKAVREGETFLKSKAPWSSG